MNRLNGWQRIWVVLMALWAVPVAPIGFSSLPTNVPHPAEYSPESFQVLYYKVSSEVLAHMQASQWTGMECDFENRLYEVTEVELKGLDKPLFLCFGGILAPPAPRIGDRKEKGGITGEWDGNTWRQVEPDPAKPANYVYNVADDLAEMRERSKPDEVRVVGEYRLAYEETLAEKRRTHVLQVVAGWALPGIALYTLGWGVGWIRRGFKSEPEVVQPARGARTRILIVVVGWIVVAWALLIVVSNAIAPEPGPWLSRLAAALATATYGVILIQRNRRAVSLTWIAVALFGAAVVFGGLVPLAMIAWGLLLAFAFYLRKYQSELRAA